MAYNNYVSISIEVCSCVYQGGSSPICFDYTNAVLVIGNLLVFCCTYGNVDFLSFSSGLSFLFDTLDFFLRPCACTLLLCK